MHPFTKTITPHSTTHPGALPSAAPTPQPASDPVPTATPVQADPVATHRAWALDDTDVPPIDLAASIRDMSVEDVSVDLPPTQEHLPLPTQEHDAEHLTTQSTATGHAPCTTAQSGTGAPGPHAVLPRQPLGLTHAQHYPAIAALLRAVGRAAVDAEASGAHAVLTGLVQGLLDRVPGAGTQGGPPAAHLQVWRVHVLCGTPSASSVQGVWQAECAACAVVLTEMLWGATRQLQSKENDTATLSPLVLHVAQCWTDPPRWQLSTADAGAQSTVNVLWLKVAVEGLGVVCRCVGPAWSADGMQVRTTLLPLLQRTGMFACRCR